MKKSDFPDSLICHLLIGLPGSGKSTIVQQWSEQQWSEQQWSEQQWFKQKCPEQASWLTSKPIVISTDRIRERLYGNADLQGDWRLIEQEVIAECQNAIAQRRSIIYDATNVRRDWRIGFLRQVNTLNKLPTGKHSAVHWMAWRVETPLEICLERNRSRDRQVPQAIIEQFNEWMRTEPVQRSEGFIAVNAIPFQNSAVDWAALLDCIQAVPTQIKQYQDSQTVEIG